MIKNAPREINGFKLYTKKPNTISKGVLYTKKFKIDTDNENKERLVRVYLPSDYNFQDETYLYKVLYMFDGKNVCDDYTSYVGEWHADEYSEDDLLRFDRGFIIVGVDAPLDGKDREDEMTIFNSDTIMSKRYVKTKRHYYGKKFANEIITKILPDVENTFNISSYKEDRAICGSSMGGLMSFYTGLAYRDYFSTILSFSPAFFLYNKKHYCDVLKKFYNSFDDKLELPRLFLYTGAGDDFESIFEELTHKTYLIFKDKEHYDRLRLIIDSGQIHNETPWSHYLKDAIDFWLDRKKVA